MSLWFLQPALAPRRNCEGRELCGGSLRERLRLRGDHSMVRMRGIAKTICLQASKAKKHPVKSRPTVFQKFYRLHRLNANVSCPFPFPLYDYRACEASGECKPSKPALASNNQFRTTHLRLPVSAGNATAFGCEMQRNTQSKANLTTEPVGLPLTSNIHRMQDIL